MKILEIISSISPVAGAETFAVNFSIELQKHSKLKVVVLHQNPNNVLSRQLQQSQIDVIYLEKRKHLDFNTVKELSRIIKNYNPDIIHTENNALITAFLSSTRTPIFHTVHLLAQYEHQGFKTIALAYRYIFSKKRVTPIAISHEGQNSILNFYHKLPNGTPLIPNGINLKRFNNQTSLKERCYDLCMVARFEEVKNHDLALKIFENIHKIYPEFRCALAGDGTLFETTKSKAEEQNMYYIDFLGSISDIPSLLSRSKIIFLSSKHEANPLSLIEGMASGCIPVAPKVGGIPDLIDDEVNGYLYSPSDIDYPSLIISKIAKNPSSFQTKAAKAKQSVQKYSIEDMTEKYILEFEKGSEKNGKNCNGC